MDSAAEPHAQREPGDFGRVGNFFAPFVGILLFTQGRRAFRFVRDNGLSQAPDWVVILLLVFAGLSLVALLSFMVGWGLQRGRRAADGN